MPATTERPDRSTPATDPVFVDPTGRRLRRGKLIGAVVIALMTAYVAVMMLAFLGGTTVDTPNLPQDPARAAAAGHESAHPSPMARQTHR